MEQYLQTGIITLLIIYIIYSKRQETEVIWDILIGVVIGLWIGAIVLSFYIENTWLNLLK